MNSMGCCSAKRAAFRVSHTTLYTTGLLLWVSVGTRGGSGQYTAADLHADIYMCRFVATAADAVYHASASCMATCMAAWARRGHVSS